MSRYSIFILHTTSYTLLEISTQKGEMLIGVPFLSLPVKGGGSGTQSLDELLYYFNSPVAVGRIILKNVLLQNSRS